MLLYALRMASFIVEGALAVLDQQMIATIVRRMQEIPQAAPDFPDISAGLTFRNGNLYLDFRTCSGASRTLGGLARRFHVCAPNQAH